MKYYKISGILFNVASFDNLNEYQIIFQLYNTSFPILLTWFNQIYDKTTCQFIIIFSSLSKWKTFNVLFGFITLNLNNAKSKYFFLQMQESWLVHIYLNRNNLPHFRQGKFMTILYSCTLKITRTLKLGILWLVVQILVQSKERGNTNICFSTDIL